MQQSSAGDEIARAIVRRTFDCDDDLAAVITARARLQAHRARSTIVACESKADHVHLVIDGHARMLAVALEGRSSVIEDYVDGDLFGERGLFGQASTPHDVVAVRQSQIGAFANGDFLALMHSYAAVGLAVSRLLVARLEQAQRRLAEGTTLSVRGRVCAELLRLAQDRPDMAITPPPVLAQLALVVDSTRETVSRTIAQLERRGVIRRDAEALTVVSRRRLEELLY
ncbi:Crp/Fnr family transcriptional regulator [Novosphingobium huizhouense]|uniref:Crp/Fnr family transcriptional regulator n=1 Tax=Novosphingobium huizhouense TaxID=2866625 RepID=UPI001CD8621A|nr:Crp/Fnr family transcriptional regulator [Novosphingobium huizhouense]